MKTIQTRRDFLLHSGAMLAGLASAGYLPTAMAADEAFPHSSGRERASRSLPSNACDSHMHIYDDRFAAVPGARLAHAAATVAMYRQIQKRNGTTRTVVVTPSAYGTDNSCTLDALAQLGADARGVGVVAKEVTDEELARLDRAGIKGLRFNVAITSVMTPEMIEPMARRIAPLGWHLQLNMSNDDLLANRDMLTKLPVPIVFDHFAKIPVQNSESHPVFKFVTDLLAAKRAYIKLSGAYLVSKVGGPSYSDVTPLARKLIDLAPTQVLWGSDWPHPTEKHKPDDAALVDMMASWAGSEEKLKALLVDNPARLYHF
ncbi:amidohydrolase family protein [Herbaspirillum sp.]|uniref:amidohydrolase family protein n=1 Tax=Herbaspirillum sp. TaxID=1890675 RepID=UPI0025BD8B97|nr:amidohydrolase family protein [Herbaspirillum sp.]